MKWMDKRTFVALKWFGAIDFVISSLMAFTEYKEISRGSQTYNYTDFLFTVFILIVGIICFFTGNRGIKDFE